MWEKDNASISAVNLETATKDELLDISQLLKYHLNVISKVNGGISSTHQKWGEHLDSLGGKVLEEEYQKQQKFQKESGYYRHLEKAEIIEDTIRGKLTKVEISLRPRSISRSSEESQSKPSTPLKINVDEEAKTPSQYSSASNSPIVIPSKSYIRKIDTNPTSPSKFNQNIWLESSRDRENVPNENWSFHPNSQPMIQPSYSLDLRADEVPIFCGDYAEWPLFAEIFEVAVNQASCPNYKKFAVLVKKTRGPPHNLIRGYPGDGSSYIDALNILKQTYQHDNLIVNALRQRLLDVKATGRDPQSLITLLNAIQGLVVRIQKYDDGIDNEIMAMLIAKKFPKYVLAPLLKKGNLKSVKVLLQDLRVNILQDIIIDKWAEVNHAQNTPSPSQNSISGQRPHQVKNNKKLFQNFDNKNHQSDNLKKKFAKSFQKICIVCPTNDNDHSIYECKKDPQAKYKEIRNQKRCENCLSDQHQTADCTSSYSCRECQKRHHTLLHINPNQSFNQPKTDFKKFQNQPKQNFQTQKKPFPPKTTTNCVTSNQIHEESNDVTNSTLVPEPSKLQKETVLMMVALAKVANPAKKQEPIEAVLFFDGGSTKSYVMTKFAKQLKLESDTVEKFQLSTFGNQEPTLICQPRHRLTIFNQSDEPHEIDVTCMEHLTAPLQTVDPVALQIEGLQPIPTSAIQKLQPDILIGGDYLWKILQLNGSTELENGFTLLHTGFGNMLTGRGKTINQSLVSPTENTYNVCETDDDDPNDLSTTSPESMKEDIDKMYQLENIGITDPLNQPEDTCINDIINTITRLEDGRYRVKWPWRTPEPNLSPNRRLAFKRLQSLLKQLQRNPNNLKRYDEVIQEQLELGIIEKVDSRQPIPRRAHYIPHRAVFKSGSDKIRVVYDCTSAERGFLSLNSCLHKGGVMLPSLVGILLRCRESHILLCADVEKAFLQVELDPADRDSTRFYWLKSLELPEDGQISEHDLLTYRFKRILFGAITSPFLLGIVIYVHLQQYGSEISQRLLRGLYVDNATIGVNNVEEAKQIYYESKNIFNDAKMNLREWSSSDPTVSKFLEEYEEAAPIEIKLLGVPWNRKLDEFILQIPSPPEKITKRILVRWINQFFDPAGWAGPIMIQPRDLLRQLWMLKLDWDVDVPEEYHQKWLLIREEYKNAQLNIPRKVSTRSPVASELHIFGDASGTAMGTVAYIKNFYDEGKPQINLMMSKSRLPPKDALTIPRAELTALQMSVNLLKFLIQESSHQFLQVYIYSDSSCSLDWLTSSKLLPRYIHNRVKKIKDVPNNTTFIHTTSKENSADVLSRGCTPSELRKDFMWKHGPPFLQQDHLPFDKFLKVIPRSTLITTEIEEVTASSVTEIVFNKIIDFDRHSQYSDLLKTSMTVYRFLQIIFKKLQREKLSSLQTLLKNQPDFKSAEKLMVYIAQRENPPTEQEHLQLRLFQDTEGILRCHGRIDTEDLPENLRNPIFLPRKHPLARHLILNFHETNLHAGESHTLSQLRQAFWIPKGRATVKNTIKKHCLHCRKERARPYRLPLMKDLPNERLNPTRPFQNIGLDHAGPYLIQTSTGPQKVWILFAVCMFTRATHCEIAYSLSTEELINCLRCLISRRGKPELIISDQGTQLQALAKCLETYPEKFKDFCLKKGISWKLNTPLSPWKGGFYERLIGIFKKSLHRAIGLTIQTSRDFQVFVTEVEAIVNSRPLAHNASDLDLICIRPVDFLIQNACLTPFPGLNQEQEEIDDPNYQDGPPSTQAKLLEYWSKKQQLNRRFQEMWRDQYLLALRDHTRWLHKQPHSTSPLTPRIQEFVIIHDENSPKTHWTVGQIEELHGNPQPTSATVRVANGKLKRPLSLLYPLELDEPPSLSPKLKQETHKKIQEMEQAQDQQDHPPPGPRRSTRIINKQKANYVYSVLMLISLFQMTCTQPINQCSSENLLNMQPNFIPPCHPDYQHLEAIFSNESFACWTKNCNNSTCQDSSQPCLSPFNPWTQWTTENHAAIVNELAKLLEVVCSWNPSPRCDQAPIKHLCSTATLMDGSTFRLESLQISEKLHTERDEIGCFGPTDNLGRNTGSPTYCARPKSSCDKSSKRICYIKSPAVKFIVTPGLEIPIMKTEVMPCQYFPHHLVNASVYVLLQLECRSDLLKISFDTTPPKSLTLEICINKECHLNTRYNLTKDTEIISSIPNRLLNKPFVVDVFVWHAGLMTNHINTTCPEDKCAFIPECTICMAWIEHLFGCYRRKIPNFMEPKIIDSWLLFFGIMVIICCLPRFCNIIKAISKLLRYSLLIPYKAIKFVYKVLCRKRKNFHSESATESTSTAPLTTRRLSNKRRQLKLTLSVCFMLCIPFGESCDNIAHIDTRAKSCQKFDNGSTICLNESQHLFVLPSSTTTTCLDLADPDGNETGIYSMTIKYSPIEYKCNPSTFFFTRDHRFETYSSRRCNGVGTCTTEACNKLRSDTYLPDIPDRVNKLPGYSFCSAACGGITCGCFYVEPSCLFYRIIATPTSTEIYSGFRCSSFSPILKLTIELKNPLLDLYQNYEATLESGIPLKINDDITVTLAANSVPPSPILMSTFLKRESDGRITMHRSPTQDHSTPGALNQLFCSTFDKAKAFECSFDPHCCRCSPATDSPNCICRNLKISEFFENSQHTIPLQERNLDIRNDNSKQHQITVVPHASSSLQIVINLKNIKSQFFSTPRVCKAKLSEFLGCYDCLTGATATLHCKTSSGSTLGTLRCANHTFAIPCNEKTIVSKVTLYHYQSILALSCELTCPLNQISLLAKGMLSAPKLDPNPGWQQENLDFSPRQGNFWEQAGEVAISTLGSITEIIKNLNPMSWIGSFWNIVKIICISAVVLFTIFGFIYVYPYLRKASNTCRNHFAKGELRQKKPKRTSRTSQQLHRIKLLVALMIIIDLFGSTIAAPAQPKCAGRGIDCNIMQPSTITNILPAAPLPQPQPSTKRLHVDMKRLDHQQ